MSDEQRIYADRLRHAISQVNRHASAAGIDDVPMEIENYRHWMSVPGAQAARMHLLGWWDALPVEQRPADVTLRNALSAAIETLRALTPPADTDSEGGEP